MSGIGVADAPHGTHLGYQVRNGRDFIGRVEHLLRAPDVMTPDMAVHCVRSTLGR
jgi:hypothetical protein